MTAVIYFGEMLIASLLAIVLLAISRVPTSSDAVVFGGGVVAWTRAEYIVHRFVLHYLAPREHGLHHANPDGAVLTIFSQIWVWFALIYFLAGGPSLRARWSPIPGICSCITARRITVPINCRYHCSSITEAIIDLPLEITASAQRCGITYSERCCADLSKICLASSRR